MTLLAPPGARGDVGEPSPACGPDSTSGTADVVLTRCRLTTLHARINGHLGVPVIDFDSLRAAAMLLRCAAGHSYLSRDSILNPLIESLEGPGNTFPVDPELPERVSSMILSTFDAVQNVRSMERWLFQGNLPDSESYVPSVRRMFHSLPNLSGDTVENPDMEPMIPIQKGKLNGHEIARISGRMEDMKRMALIHLLSAGSAGEKKAAVRELRRRTGLRMTSVSAWKRWWRQKY